MIGLVLFVTWRPTALHLESTTGSTSGLGPDLEIHLNKDGSAGNRRVEGGT